MLDKLNIENNEIYENIKNFSELCVKANKKDLYRGFFEFYENKDSDYLNIRNNNNNLKVFDNIKQTFSILDKIDNLKISYLLTEKCSKCNPIGTTELKKLNVILDFDEADFLYNYNVEDLTNEKINYSNGHCPKCDYDKKGKLLKTKKLTKIVSNLKFPNIIFFNFQTDNYENPINLNTKIKKVFKNKITIFSESYHLAEIVFMPTKNHFTAEIFHMIKGIVSW